MAIATFINVNYFKLLYQITTLRKFFLVAICIWIKLYMYILNCDYNMPCMTLTSKFYLDFMRF